MCLNVEKGTCRRNIHNHTNSNKNNQIELFVIRTLQQCRKEEEKMKTRNGIKKEKEITNTIFFLSN